MNMALAFIGSEDDLGSTGFNAYRRVIDRAWYLSTIFPPNLQDATPKFNPIPTGYTGWWVLVQLNLEK